jgi:hypothetical protein
MTCALMLSSVIAAFAGGKRILPLADLKKRA